MINIYGKSTASLQFYNGEFIHDGFVIYDNYCRIPVLASAIDEALKYSDKVVLSLYNNWEDKWIKIRL